MFEAAATFNHPLVFSNAAPERVAPLARPEADLDSKERLLRHEREAWEKVFGTKVELPDLPDFIDRALIERMRGSGFTISAIPNLDIGNEADLKAKGVRQFLDSIQEKYPGWKSPEKMGREKLCNCTECKLPEAFFWEKVEAGKTPFPDMSGRWLVLEPIPKPYRGQEYIKTKLMHLLGLDSRLGIPQEQIIELLQEKQGEILGMLGLETGEVSLPSVMEWNVLANRDGWGISGLSEWTRTGFQDRGIGQGNTRVDEHKFIIGEGNYGGAASVSAFVDYYPLRDVGFRTVIEFGGTTNV
jgi:hypothetical protein